MKTGSVSAAVVAIGVWANAVVQVGGQLVAGSSSPPSGWDGCCWLRSAPSGQRSCSRPPAATEAIAAARGSVAARGEPGSSPLRCERAVRCLGDRPAVGLRACRTARSSSVGSDDRVRQVLGWVTGHHEAGSAAPGSGRSRTSLRAWVTLWVFRVW